MNVLTHKVVNSDLQVCASSYLVSTGLLLAQIKRVWHGRKLGNGFYQRFEMRPTLFESFVFFIGPTSSYFPLCLSGRLVLLVSSTFRTWLERSLRLGP